MQSMERSRGLLAGAGTINLRDAVSSGDVANVRQYLAQGVDANAIYRVVRDDPFIVTASYLGNSQVLQLLLDNRTQVDDPDAGGDTGLLHASRDGNTACVKILLAHGASVHGSVWTKTGLTPLAVGCLNGHAECVQLLVDAGAPVNSPSIEGTYPLHIAAMRGHADVIKILLAAGADRTVTFDVSTDRALGLWQRPVTPLQVAELTKHAECVQLLRGTDGQKGGSESSCLSSRGGKRKR